MKKIILSIVAVLAFGYANAQIKTDAGTFGKPTAGTIIMEVTMTPNIAGGGIFSLPTLNSELGLIGIKARKFSSDKQALRVAANLSVLSSGEEDAAGDKEDTEFAVGVAVGMEHHMAGAERLSTYWGYEGNIGYVSSNGEVDATGALVTPKQTKLGLGANLLAGFDYYIMPKIYLGAEVSYGLAVTSTKPDGGDGVTKLQLAPGITPSFRLGWQF
jgi:hypothetical protein